MAYRPQVKTSNGMVDLPIDAETIKGKTLLEQTYPVGAIYLSVNNTSPASLFGGTWEQLKDKFLLGAGDTYTNGATGGSATHTHTTDNLRACITMDDDGSYIYINGRQESSDAWHVNRAYKLGSMEKRTLGTSTSGFKVNGSLGTGDNMPPYLTVYMWKRIA